MYTGNCGPLPSVNGYVLPYTSTLEGSRLMFMCQDGPQSELTAVCTGAGKWYPSEVLSSGPWAHYDQSVYQVEIFSCTWNFHNQYSPMQPQ